MSKSFAPLIAALALSVTTSASACHTIYPDLEGLDRYSAVFVGNVTAIHLVGYERELRGVGDFTIEGEAFSVT